MGGRRATIASFLVVASALMGCGDDDPPGTGAEEEQTEEAPAEEEQTVDTPAPVEEQTVATPPSSDDELASGTSECLPPDAVVDPEVSALTVEQVDEIIEAAIVDDQRSQLAGFEPYTFDADALLEEVDGLSVEAAVREMFITIAGVDPLGPESTEAQSEAYVSLVEQAWIEFGSRCDEGEAFEEARNVVLLSIGERIDETYPSAIVDVSCGQLDDRLREIGETIGATEGPAAGQLASAEEYQAYLDELVALGFPANSPIGGFVTELSDDTEAQLALVDVFERFDAGLAAGDQAVLDAASVDFFTNAQITIDEGREAAAAAEAAGLDTCVEVFTRSSDEGQASLDELLAQPTE